MTDRVSLIVHTAVFFRCRRRKSWSKLCKDADDGWQEWFQEEEEEEVVEENAGGVSQCGQIKNKLRKNLQESNECTNCIPLQCT